MTKAILVLDIDYDIEDLQAKIELSYQGDVVSIFRNLSLKEMPNDMIQDKSYDNYNKGLTDGWNACLHEIEREINNV